jgi:hypothetical protein
MENILTDIKIIKEKKSIPIMVSVKVANKLRALNKGSYNRALEHLLDLNPDKRALDSLEEHEQRLDKMEEMLSRILIKLRL